MQRSSLRRAKTKVAAPMHDDPRSAHAPAVLTGRGAEALSGRQMSMIFIVGGLAGPDAGQPSVPRHAAAPVDGRCCGSAPSLARPLSGLSCSAMGWRKPVSAGRSGRRAWSGGLLAAIGLWVGSYWLFMRRSASDRPLYVGAGFYFAFAATDTACLEADAAKRDLLGHGWRLAAAIGHHRAGAGARHRRS